MAIARHANRGKRVVGVCKKVGECGAVALIRAGRTAVHRGKRVLRPLPRIRLGSAALADQLVKKPTGKNFAV